MVTESGACAEAVEAPQMMATIDRIAISRFIIPSLILPACKDSTAHAAKRLLRVYGQSWAPWKILAISIAFFLTL